MTGEYQRIFVAIDENEKQDRIVDRAIDMALSNGAALKFGHVVELTPPFLVDVPDASFTIYTKDIVGKQAEKATAALELLVEKARALGVNDASYEIQIGKIRNTLLEKLIQPFEPDLVICGDRGLSALEYVLIGSISKFIVEHAACDVLVVRNS